MIDIVGPTHGEVKVGPSQWWDQSVDHRRTPICFPSSDRPIMNFHQKKAIICFHHRTTNASQHLVDQQIFQHLELLSYQCIPTFGGLYNQLTVVTIIIIIIITATSLAVGLGIPCITQVVFQLKCKIKHLISSLKQNVVQGSIQ